MCSYSVVIPCYRSGAWLGELVERIAAAMAAVNEPFEVILVNDASPDDTWTAIEELTERFSFVRGFDLLFNAGQFRATMCGLEQARGEQVVIMDDDLQHPPEAIPTLIAELRSRPDLDCVMARFDAPQHGLLRRIGSRFAAFLFTYLYGKPRAISPSSFRILRSAVVRAMCQHQTVNPVIGPLIYRSTRRIGNVSVQHLPRQRGRSGYSLPKLIRIVLNSYFSASTVPLRGVSLLGLLSALASVVLGISYLTRYWLNKITLPGFATQVLLTLFFGGLTLFAVGLVGEYMIRIMDEVRRAPRYFIRARADSRVASGAAQEQPPDARRRTTV